jgi:hypothetical protein
MGKRRLNVLRRRWRAESLVYCGLMTVAGSVLLTAAMHVFVGWPYRTAWAIGVGLGTIVVWRSPYWRIVLTDIVRYLDRRLPELEESCGLLLRSPAELNSLEGIQARKVEERLERVMVPDPLRKKLIFGFALVVMAVLLSAGLGTVAERWVTGPHVAATMAGVERREAAARGIRAVRIRIAPPAYTGRAMREQAGFGLRVEEDAVVGWELETEAGVDTVEFIFNDSNHVVLSALDTNRSVWRYSEKVMRSGFYQVRVGRKLSPLYQLEVQADEPPQVLIQAPKPYTVIDYGEATKISVRVFLKDDYGIADASLVLTVSSGSGEAVRFKQQELRWSEGFDGSGRAYSLSNVLDLESMGVRPGDELYFYCRAKDSRGQEGRTETYIISLADTAQLMSLAGITVGTDVKPEFFRSERQIIIEAEQLLRQRDTMAVTAYRDKSNELGMDQKLLRLRYGKFLGEEAEEGEGVGGGPGDTTDYGTFGDAARILQVITDQHDHAEDATYFEPVVKQQLKSTLNEMWKAELRLRTYQPQEALPFAYKALRLLKDLQQQSRVYVAKTGVRVTPLNPAKRLTGELGAIEAPVQELAAGGSLTEEEVLRMALAVLESGREGAGDSAILRRAGRKLGAAAAAKPSMYLSAYQSLRGILEGGSGDIVGVERAIRQLLPEVEAAPGLEKAPADGGLGKLYFEEIDR